MDVPSKRNPILTHGSSTMRKRFFESPPHWSWSRVEIIRSGFNCQAKTSPSLYGNTPHKSLTYQLLMGTSNLSMASFANIQSTPMTAKTLTVPANNFSVISGSMSGFADSSIYTNVDRVRAAMTSPVLGVVSASYYFKILASSPTVLPDSDGVTRQGF